MEIKKTNALYKARKLYEQLVKNQTDRIKQKYELKLERKLRKINKQYETRKNRKIKERVYKKELKPQKIKVGKIKQMAYSMYQYRRKISLADDD